MDAFPAFIPLRGARVVIAGDGEAADAKARLFAASPAELVRLTDRPAAVRVEGYAGARLAFIALPEPLVAEAAAAARAAGAWVNVVDQPSLCDFHTPALIDRGAIVGAIGSAGAAPLLASRLRTEWEARWPDRLGELARLLAEMRGPVRTRLADGRARRAALLAMLDGPAGAAALAGRYAEALALATDSLDRVSVATTGRVVELIAPTDAETLTLKDLRVLARADRLVADETVVNPAVLAHARRDAVRSAAADAATLAAWAGAGDTVVVIRPPPTPAEAEPARP